MKPASKKSLRAELLAIQTSLTATILSSIFIPVSISHVCVLQLEVNRTSADWIESQWTAVITESSMPVATPSSKRLPAPSNLDGANQTKIQVVGSSSEKILPPLVTPVKPSRSNSFTQLFRRLMPRFDNRSSSPSVDTPLRLNKEGIASSQAEQQQQHTGYKMFYASGQGGSSSPFPTTHLLSFLRANKPDSNNIPGSTELSLSEDMLALSISCDAVGCHVIDPERKVTFGSKCSSILESGGWSLQFDNKVADPSNDQTRYGVLKMSNVFVLFQMTVGNFDDCIKLLRESSKQTFVDAFVWSKHILKNACDRQQLV